MSVVKKCCFIISDTSTLSYTPKHQLYGALHSSGKFIRIRLTFHNTKNKSFVNSLYERLYVSMHLNRFDIHSPD